MKSYSTVEKAMAEDIYKKYSALVSVSEMAEYFGLSWQVVANRLVNCKTFGDRTGKRYFYQEVAEAFCREEGK